MNRLKQMKKEQMSKKMSEPKTEQTTEEQSELKGERLQKVLANAGVASRREIERMISAGRIQVNGQVAALGDRIEIDANDKIELDGRVIGHKRLAGPEARRIIIYNKPEGELVTRHDPEGRATIFSRLPKLKQGRWIAIGRLDINTSGLLLLTTDGELANRLMHPSKAIEREYAVRVLGQVGETELKQLTAGIELEDGPARFEEVVESGGTGANRWFHVVIVEGRQREVRRLWEAVGAQVSRLKRVRFGSVILDSSVPAGRNRDLTEKESATLLELVGMEADEPVRKPERKSSRQTERPTRSTTRQADSRRAQPDAQKRKSAHNAKRSQKRKSPPRQR
ncbi:MAG: 23S rRNA pseudouridine(2605) synthase RluB [Candidatus Polarisedimenticolaceae bacterium]|nr:23S rRNA pseudouridine(2605) synthase RluB [Candidatus Polarisedimenticolaceae bacterium]